MHPEFNRIYQQHRLGRVSLQMLNHANTDVTFSTPVMLGVRQKTPLPQEVSIVRPNRILNLSDVLSDFWNVVNIWLLASPANDFATSIQHSQHRSASLLVKARG